MCWLKQLLSALLACVLLASSVLADEDRPGQWNKAMGLWGKRSGPPSELFQQSKRPIENWNKLNTLWGKRSDPLYYNGPSEFSGFKRASWQTANGLWGRRK